MPMSKKPNNTIAVTPPLETIRELIKEYRSNDDPEVRLKDVSTKIDKMLAEKFSYLVEIDDYKTLSINEFNNGLLMCESVLDLFKTFAIDLMRKLQQEYNCQATSEKATAELAAMEYVRILELEWRMSESLTSQQGLARAHTCGSNNSSFSPVKTCCACNRAVIELKIYENLGRELDRATRNYLNAVQTLKMMNQQPFQINVKANTAVVGQNQQVQTNHTNNHVPLI